MARGPHGGPQNAQFCSFFIFGAMFMKFCMKNIVMKWNNMMYICVMYIWPVGHEMALSPPPHLLAFYIF